MNEEQEMSLDTEQQPAEETAEQAVPDGDNSAQEAQEPAAEQTAAEPAQQAQGAENDPTPPPGNDVPDAGDDYDDFYHDMSDFEQPTDEAESGNTPIDPEGEDEDEGGNQGEAEPEVQPEEQPETDATAPEQDEPAETAPGGQVDFGSWEAEDRAAILAAHPELEATLKGKHLRDVLDDPGLFGYMRGSAENRAKYSAVEAFEKASANLLATRAATSRAKQDSKQHIRSGNGKAAAPTGSIPADMMRQLRSMFPDKTRAELEQLYKNVT